MATPTPGVKLPAPGSVRARVVIVHDDALAPIERQRGGVRSGVSPGGGVEPGETPELAAAREAYEELALRVALGVCIAEVIVGDTRQHFYLVTPRGGTLGLGLGAEMVGEYPPARGTYRAVWLPLAALPAAAVYPRAIAELVSGGAERGWPATPLRLREPARQSCQSDNRRRSPFTPPHAAGYTSTRSRKRVLGWTCECLRHTSTTSLPDGRLTRQGLPRPCTSSPTALWRVTMKEGCGATARR